MWNIFILIDGDRIESLTERLPDFGERGIRLRLLRGRDSGYSITESAINFPRTILSRNRVPAALEKDFLSLLNFLLSLDFGLAHELHRWFGSLRVPIAMAAKGGPHEKSVADVTPTQR